jgi:hypothetical protein
MNAHARRDPAADVGDTADLLETAREALLGELLPEVPADRRYTALMIANAIAIVAREFALGDDADDREVEWLRGLAADIASPADPESADLPALRRTVTAAIRDGCYDDAAHAEALTRALLHVTADRVAISNPKALRK